MIRIGHGFDVHAFTSGDHLILGGIKIPFDKAFLAHSDGDVLIHAICDALLGALALGDIGKHFPPSDNQWKNCKSDVFLVEIYKMVVQKGFVLNNLDCTVICEKPKLKTYIQPMRKHIASALKVSPEQISIKATTTEKLGYCGRKEGIAAHAVCLIQSENL